MKQLIESFNAADAFRAEGGEAIGVRKADRSVIVTCYEHIPDFAAAELERLYSSIFSSLALFAVYEAGFDKTRAYVVREDGEITTLLLFRIEGRRVKVLNEVMRLESHEIQRFARNIFARYPNVGTISFHAIHADLQRMSFPYQAHNCLEDMVLDLPATEQEYLSHLGKNTRRNLKRYGERLQRTFPSFEFATFERDKIDQQDIRDIVQLNQARMACKHKKSIIDDAETERIISLTRSHGVIGVARIDGVICAGAISYQVGDHYYLSVLAHAPEYDDYWIGILCCYQTIQECIRRGGKVFHFLWGRYDYKSILLAQRRDLNHVEIYRSWPSMCLNPVGFVRTFNAGKLRQLHLKAYALRHQKQSGALNQIIKALLDTTRQVKPHRH